RIGVEIGPDGLRLDAAVALDNDLGSLGEGMGGTRHGADTGTQDATRKDRAEQTQSPKPPHPQPHAQCALRNTANRLDGVIAVPTQDHVCTGFFPLRNTACCCASPVSSRIFGPTGYFPHTVSHRSQVYDAMNRDHSPVMSLIKV